MLSCPGDQPDQQLRQKISTPRTFPPPPSHFRLTATNTHVRTPLNSCRRQTKKIPQEFFSPLKKQPRKIERKNNRLKTKSRTAKADDRYRQTSTLPPAETSFPSRLNIFPYSHSPRHLPTENISPTDGPLFSTSIAAGSHSTHTPLLLHSPPEKPTPEITPAGDSEGHA